MDRKKAYAISFGIDALLLCIIFGVYRLGVYLLEIHPLLQFLSQYNLGYIQQHPELLPPDSVLYSGIATLLLLTIGSTLLFIYLLFKSRALLYNQLVHGSWKKIADKTALKMHFFECILVIIPLWFIYYVSVSVIVFFINLIPNLSIVIFLQQFVLTIIISFVLFVLTEYALFFYKKKSFFSNYPSFLKSLSFKRFKHIFLVVSVFFLATFVLQKILGNFYQIAFLESAYYYVTSLILISIIRVETYLQKA